MPSILQALPIVLSIWIAIHSSVIAQENPAIEFWKTYDARSESLDVEVVKEWEDDLGNYQLVRYRLGKLEGSNRSASPVIAAYYGSPKTANGSTKVPGIVHIHGGGQAANKGRVATWVELGYACISINWGGKVLETEQTANTDWDGLAAGFVRPGIEQKELTHHNQVSPGPHTLYEEPHLLNSSWSLIAMSARRALTFLEQRPEVDAERLGVEGHSMGGRATVLTAIDPRVMAASPSVGGTGFLFQDMWGLPGSARRMSAEDGLELYQKTISSQAYWPHIQAPVLFLEASNDFNAPMDLVAKGMGLLPDSTASAWSTAPHLNHRFTEDTSAARFMWMETYLKGNFTFPRTSASEWVLDTADHVPLLRVSMDESKDLPIEKVQIYYGYARDARIRFWRSAITTEREAGVYEGKCPVFDIQEPLFAFANVTYRMPRTLPAMPGMKATNLLTVSSQYQIAYPKDLQTAEIRATEVMQWEIDDFSRGWQDWYRLNEGNSQFWFYGTRKIVDPAWMGPRGGKLVLEVQTSAAGNRLAVGMPVNTWQNYTGRPRDEFHAIVSLPNEGPNTVELLPEDFRNSQGEHLKDWGEATELTLTPSGRIESAKRVWLGEPLGLKRIYWQGGKLAPRPHPHQSSLDPTAGDGEFDREFQNAIRDSVDLEKVDEEDCSPSVQQE